MVPSPRNYQSASPSNSYGGASTSYDDDAALAKALQDEYEREYRRRGMRQHLDGLAFDPPIAPSAPYSSGGDADVFRDPFYSPSGSGNGTPDFAFGPSQVYHDIEVSDEAYAMQLEQQMVEEALQRQRQRASEQQRGATRKAPSRSNSTDSQRLPPTSSSGTRGRSMPIVTHDNSIHQQRSSRSLSRKDSSIPTTTSRSQSRNPPSRSNSINHSHSQRSLNNTSERSRRSQSNPRSKPPSRSNSNNWNNTHTMPTAIVVSPDDMSDFQVLSDEELAKRLELEELQARMEQEDRDNELARQCLVEDQIRRAAVMQSQRAAQPKSKCPSFRRCFSCILLLVVIAAGVYAALYFTGNTSVVGDFGIPDPQQFREEDPFNNANPKDANLWITKGVGLELTVINALEDHWDEFFTTAVAQWDNGTPDALTLTVQYEDPQSVCSAENGVLKVCNGNYGDTNWRGINKVLLENGWIYSSAARMNEYYLTRNYEKDFSQMSYTMCHEIGKIGIAAG